MIATITQDDTETNLTGGASEIVGSPSHAVCRASIDCGRNSGAAVIVDETISPGVRRGRPVPWSAYIRLESEDIEVAAVQDADSKEVAVLIAPGGQEQR